MKHFSWLVLASFAITLPIRAEVLPTASSDKDSRRLSFSNAMQIAATQSTLITANTLRADSAREMAKSAGLLPDPILRFGITNLPINGTDRFSLTRDFMTMRSIGVMQELTREDKRTARTRRFEKEAETAEVSRQLAERNIQRNLAVAWIDRYYQERMLEWLKRQKNEAKLLIEAADAAYRSGKGSQSDLFAVRSSVAQLDDRIALGERQVQSSKSQLARWVGDLAGLNLGSLPALDTLKLKESKLHMQLEQHPQILVMQKQVEAAQADADLANANKKPDWNAELMFSQRGSAFSNMISINLSVPLQLDQKNRQDRELAAKQLIVMQLRAEREDGLRALIAEARTMLQEWQTNRVRLQRFDTFILPLTVERTQAALAAYRGGSTTNGSLNAVLEARRAEIDAGIERLALEMETARLWAQLNYFSETTSGE